MRREPDSPDSLLDEARDHPEWDEGRLAEQIDLLIARHAPERLASALLPRLGDLGGHHGEVVLRLVEALARPDLFAALADALVDQPDLPPERLWDAIGLLDGTGLVEERPRLVEWRDDLEELLAEDSSLEDLAAQIEDDPDSIAVALEGLARIEPDVREEIIEGLAAGPRGPGVADLLERLARSGFVSKSEASPEARSSFAIGSSGDSWRIDRSVVGPMNRDGEAGIGLLSEGPDGWAFCVFRCHVLEGLVQARGSIESDRRAVRDLFEEFARSLGADAVEGREDVALVLLAGAAWLSRGEVTPDVRRWLLLAAGPRFEPRPLFAGSISTDPRAIGPEEMVEGTRLILATMTDWRDDSELVRELAVELALKDGDSPPDLGRDPGPFRVLFENRIRARVERYRRMLIWSSLAWDAKGRSDLATAARAFAGQLSDPQHAVPGHPFLSAFMAQSFAAAQEGLRSASPAVFSPGAPATNRFGDRGENAEQRSQG